jgi:PiT family inorganic phosphate transporter
MIAASWIFRSSAPLRVDHYFRKLQLVSAAAVSLGHGMNDAQKTMGIVTTTLVAAGMLQTFAVPRYVILMANAAMGLGTLFGGWRIVRTMGMKITKLKPVGGFCAEAAAAASILGTALAGIPVSTTHTIAGAIMGVGSIQRLSAVRWGVARNIIWAWILTIPVSAIVAAICFWILHSFFPAA